MRIACLHLPNLAIQAVLQERFGAASSDLSLPPAIPLAIVEGPTDRRFVYAATPAAADAGVTARQPLAAARATCPELIIVLHDPALTEDALERLADTLGCFGPTVSLAPPQTLLVDTTGVPGISGVPGTPITAARLRETAASLGFAARAAIASTPFAARALATHACPERPTAAIELTSPPDERRAIERLPLAAVGLPDHAYHALHVVGTRTVGAFMALPAAALSRRFGPEVRHLWRQAHARAVPKLVAHIPDRPIVERSQHDAPLTTVEPLTFALKRLVDRALLRLTGRGQGALELTIVFDTEPFSSPPGRLNPASLGTDPDGIPLTPDTLAAPPGPSRIQHPLILELSQVTTDTTLLLQLLRERLNRRPPPGAVHAMALHITHAAAQTSQQLTLFGDPAPRETIDTTLARLAAILGGERRFSPRLREDFRPEHAWDLVPLSKPSATPPREPAAPPPGPRPTRLLRQPEPIPKLRHVRAPPRPLAGPERLVTGWWDGNPIARDYWIIADRWGRRSWIFRDLAAGTWFLHGHFD